MSRTSGLTRDDRAYLAEVGLAVEEVERQVALLGSPPPPIRLDRACTLGDGITRLVAGDDERLLPLWEGAAAAGRLSKFVPASGAASRMFDAAVRVRKGGAPSRTALDERRVAGDTDAAAVVELLDRLGDLPFAETVAAQLGCEVVELGRLGSSEEVTAVLAALLDEGGLGLASLAKGMIPFHRYDTESRTAFQEHLIEGGHYITDAEGRARHHFTVPPAQQSTFERTAAALGERHRLSLDLSFSVQDPSTDTVAIDRNGALVRHADGQLRLRPGGHGALIGNLEGTRGDIVFVKNIDNVVPSPDQPEVALWMQRLAGLLLETERTSHSLQERLSADEDALDDAEAFCRERLAWEPGGTSTDERRQQILQRLDRPLRVCGMVRNEGEPGGGPFWVREADGTTSLQIVESAQIDADDPSQREIWTASTHFNPVLLVASLRNRHGAAYRLADFVDEQAVFISSKPIGGEIARALERPGLWNGAMAYWNTTFVEVPIATFAPVKTVLDLLRPAHRVGAG